MYRVNINGSTYESDEDKSLLRFLRDDLNLTATKDGCSEGVCGTCTVLVDGEKRRACITRLSKLEGKTVVTVEGIPVDARCASMSTVLLRLELYSAGFVLPAWLSRLRVFSIRL